MTVVEKIKKQRLRVMKKLIESDLNFHERMLNYRKKRINARKSELRKINRSLKRVI